MKHFTFQEFERSATATRHGIDNSIPEAAKKNIAALVDNVLDPLREAWGGPIDVTSGYRCHALNKAVGGAKGSQHMAGEAADLRIFVRKNGRSGPYVLDSHGNKIVDEAANRQLFQMIQQSGLPFDQLIDENGMSWVHVSHKARGNNRRESKKLRQR